MGNIAYKYTAGWFTSNKNERQLDEFDVQIYRTNK